MYRSSRYLYNSCNSSFIGWSAFRSLVELAVDRLYRTTFQILFVSFIESLAIDKESTRNSFGSAIDVCVTVGKAYDKRGANHAASNEFLRKQGAERLRALTILVASGKNEVAGTSGNFEETFQMVFSDGLIDESAETLALLPEALDHMLFAIDSDGFKRSRKSMTFRAMSGG